MIAQKLFTTRLEPSTKELMQLSIEEDAFCFLENEPKLYTLTDGEPIS